MTIVKVVSRTLKNGKKRSVCIERKLGEVYILVQEEDKNKTLLAPSRWPVDLKEDEVNAVIGGLANIMDIKDLTISDFKNYEEFGEVFRLTDRYVMLRRLLEEVPETDNPDEFDRVIETRRRVWREIHQIIEDIGKRMEDEWCDKVWEKVKHKTLKTDDGDIETVKRKRKWE